MTMILDILPDFDFGFPNTRQEEHNDPLQSSY